MVLAVAGAMLAASAADAHHSDARFDTDHTFTTEPCDLDNARRFIAE